MKKIVATLLFIMIICSSQIVCFAGYEGKNPAENQIIGTNADFDFDVAGAYLWEATTGKVLYCENEFKAQLFNCSISISNYGGDGGTTPKIAFKINVNGTPKNGTVTLTDGTPTFNATV